MTCMALIEFIALNSIAKVLQIRLGNWQRIALSPSGDPYHLLLWCTKLDGFSSQTTITTSQLKEKSSLSSFMLSFVIGVNKIGQGSGVTCVTDTLWMSIMHWKSWSSHIKATFLDFFCFLLCQDTHFISQMLMIHVYVSLYACTVLG